MEVSIITTIAWDGKILAADSRTTSGSHLISDTGCKLFQLEGVCFGEDKLLAIAVSGSCCDTDKVLRYLNICKSVQDFTHEVDAIIVGVSRVYKLESNSGYLIPYYKDTKLAYGSGGVFARSALVLGMTAVDAVKHAMLLDMSTGGEVIHMEF